MTSDTITALKVSKSVVAHLCSARQEHSDFPACRIKGSQGDQVIRDGHAEFTDCRKTEAELMGCCFF